MKKQTLIDIANPLHPKGGYALPWTPIFVGLGFLIAFLLGVFSAHLYDAHYFQQKYRASERVNVVRVAAPRLRVTAPAAASVNLLRYPGVLDQDGIGACAAYAASQAMTYEWRLAHPTSWLNYSPRWLYDLFSDTNNSCQDGGSSFPLNIQLANQYGSLRRKALSDPPYTIDCPGGPDASTVTRLLSMLDTWGHPVSQDLQHKPWSVQVLASGQGEGQGAIDAIHLELSTGHPVGIAFPVWPEYDNATQQPLIISPTPFEVQSEPQGRGGHENVIIAYDDTKVFPDGTVGGAEVQNQWTKAWGSNGRAWFSYDFIRKYAYELATTRLLTSATQAPRGLKDFVPNNAPKHRLSTRTPTKLPREAAWYVHNVVTHDTKFDVSSLMNAWGDKYGVWPVALAAVAGTESGINQYADRPLACPDCSFGLMQFTVPTAEGYGVCSSYDGCRVWLDSPGNSIYLAALYLHQAAVATCETWPWLYVAYNAGPGLGCGAYFYTHPTGQAYTNFYDNFLPNYTYAIATFSCTSGCGPLPQPKPKPYRFVFPWGRWNAACHDCRAIDRMVWKDHHGHLTWPASIFYRHQTVGGFIRQSWYGVTRTRRYGFMVYTYQRDKALAWPAFRTYKIVR